MYSNENLQMNETMEEKLIISSDFGMFLIF